MKKQKSLEINEVRVIFFRLWDDFKQNNFPCKCAKNDFLTTNLITHNVFEELI